MPAGARDWFLAEGSTGNFFEMFVLISNPNTSTVTATVRYLTPSGVARTEQRSLPPTSRTTIPVDSLPGLGATDVSVSVNASANVIVERSMSTARCCADIGAANAKTNDRLETMTGIKATGH